MVAVTFALRDGQETPVEARAGFTLMEVAVANDIEGIDAECGGSAACGTCRVIVSDEWADRLPKPATLETDMLEMVADERNARLACQIRLTEDLNGILVRIPPEL